MVEGKLKIWIKGGSFSHSSDLYIKILAVAGEKQREVWKTDESDSSSPKWDSTVEKHVKGEYEKLLFNLMDEDTFSRDDLLGSCEVSFEKLAASPIIGDLDMTNADGEKIGTIDVSIEFEEGDVNAFQLLSSRLHTSDSD